MTERSHGSTPPRGSRALVWVRRHAGLRFHRTSNTFKLFVQPLVLMLMCLDFGARCHSPASFGARGLVRTPARAPATAAPDRAAAIQPAACRTGPCGRSVFP